MSFREVIEKIATECVLVVNHGPIPPERVKKNSLIIKDKHISILK